jgi:hypothetical protein
MPDPRRPSVTKYKLKSILFSLTMSIHLLSPCTSSTGVALVAEQGILKASIVDTVFN